MDLPNEFRIGTSYIPCLFVEKCVESSVHCGIGKFRNSGKSLYEVVIVEILPSSSYVEKSKRYFRESSLEE